MLFLFFWCETGAAFSTIIMLAPSFISVNNHMNIWNKMEMLYVKCLNKDYLINDAQFIFWDVCLWISVWLSKMRNYWNTLIYSSCYPHLVCYKQHISHCTLYMSVLILRIMKWINPSSQRIPCLRLVSYGSIVTWILD